MTSKLLTFFLSAFLFGVFPAHAATYYVNPSTGNDSNDGSSGSPWLTFQKGCDTAVAADTVVLKDGTFTENAVCQTNSGSLGSLITFVAENQYGAIFDSSETVTGWSNSGEATDVYHSDTTTTIASTFKALWKVTETTSYNEETTEADLGANEFFWDSANTRFKIYHPGSTPSGTWKGWDAGNDNIHFRNVSYIVINGVHCRYGDQCIKTGFAGNGTVGNTNNITIKNSKVEYVTERGVTIDASPDNPSDGVIVEDNIIRYIDSSSESASINGHCIKLASNVVGDHGTGAIIRNNTIDSCDYHGIQASNGWKESIIDGNTISNTNLNPVRSEGNGAIRVGGDVAVSNTYVTGNTITGSRATGVQISADVGGVYVDGNNLSDLVYAVNINIGGSDIYITNNLFRDSDAGVNSYASAGTVYIWNNTFEGFTVGAPINIETLTDSVDIQNNIFYTTNKNNVVIEAAVTWSENNNSFYRSDAGNFITIDSVGYSNLATYQGATSQGADSIYGDPLFTDRVGNNYTLTAPSPAIEQGADLSPTVTLDYAGNSRTVLYDMGAYEYSTSGSPGGAGAAGISGGTIAGGRLS